MKDKGPLVEGSCGGGLEDAERRSPHSPHGPAAEAIGGAPGIRLAAGREVAGPAADWLRRQAEVMLLSVAPPAPGKPRVSAGRRRRRRRRRRLLRVSWRVGIAGWISEIRVALNWSGRHMRRRSCAEGTLGPGVLFPNGTGPPGLRFRVA